jgi:hypothetical protein
MRKDQDTLKVVILSRFIKNVKNNNWVIAILMVVLQNI